MRAAEAISMMNEMRRILNSFKEELAADRRRERKELIEMLSGFGLIEPEEELWTIKDLMTKFGVSRGTIYKMMKNGTLPFIRLGNSKNSPVRFRPVDARAAFMEYRN